MSIYTDYATTLDVAAYLGIDVSELPSDINRLISRASELIKQITLDNIIDTNDDHLEAAKLATCAQIEYWQNGNEYSNISQLPASYSLGNLSIDYNKSTSGSVNSSIRAQLCKRSINYLAQQGLLYSRVYIDSDCDDSKLWRLC